MTVETQERTDDAMYRGAVRVLQHRKGYRFSFDAVLLAYAVAQRRPAFGVELCAGSGVVSLCVAHLLPQYRGYAVEVQPGLAALAAENVERNGCSDRIEVVERDARRFVRPRSEAATVFMNPPYFAPGEGPSSPNLERAAARHQMHGTLTELLGAAREAAGEGEVVFVYPGEREAQAVAAARAAGLASLTLTHVRPRPGAAATFLLVRCTANGSSGIEVSDGMLLQDDAGEMSDEHRCVLDGLLRDGVLR